MAKSKLPRSTPAARPGQPPQPKLPEASNPLSQSAKLSMPGASTPPRSASPSSLHEADISSLSASAKKKKKKSKARAKDSDFVDEHDFDLQTPNLAQRPRSPTSLAARAQAQAQLLAAASELYRRIEGDPQGIPDDDAYWTSLPSHLRTFIRNALPLGQFPPAAQAALDGNPNDPKNRHDSTKAMIAVAQQLAQAAHASQRHLQQYPSGNHPYPPLPFDPSIFADLALHPDQPMPLLAHPNSNSSAHATNNGTYAQYASSPNPPPTQPPVEPLPPPVVLYNNFDDDPDRYDDRDDGEEYCSYDELEAEGAMLDPQGNLLRNRNGVWVHDDSDHVHGPNGISAISDNVRASSKTNKKKKKKKKGSTVMNPAEDDLHDVEPEAPIPPKLIPSHQAPTTNVSSVNRSTNPPPSSRAAGKQPMTFSSNGKTPARPGSGVAVPSNSGKRSVSSSTHGQLNPTVNNAKIWSTSSAEERERIKEFWLQLSMKDRQKLVQVEKETVLKKMKEQQRHLCSCAVCGRKRSAIEDELEVLYDAYYDELEDYANHQQRWVTSGGTIPPPPGPGPFPGSVALDSSGTVIGGDPLSKARGHARDGRHTHNHHHHHHHHGQTRSALHPESSDGYDDEELDEDADYDDEDDDAEYDDDEDEDDLDLERERARDDYHKRAPVIPAGRRRGVAPDDHDLFGLGNSLTVKGGILTVADDMLKNDGRKFLEMMEQLAERRMHREELTAADLGLETDDDEDHPDDLDDEEDLEDDEDEEEDNILTDEQRMEEGRKMFQIFAARMFEQRVLQAYRERVAQERQLQLLRELEEEDSNEKAREARRQKETQKKKDKKKAQKEAKDAEKNRKDLEKAAAEAEARAQLQAVRDAELRKQEEIRSKKDAERRLKDEEKAKKDEEKRRRLAEEREREAERERKRKEKEEKVRLEREAQEQAKREKEDEARRVKEEQERVQREKADKERKAKEEQERKSESLKKEKEAKAQVQRDAKQAALSSALQSRAAPVSPAGTRSSATKSPGPVNAQSSGRNAKAGSIPSSPAVLPSNTRAAGGSRGGAAQKLTSAPMSTGAAAVAATPSTLPAPPQGLPPRPSTAVLTPTGSVSQGSSVSVAANAGLPRPPLNSGVPTSLPPLGFGSIGAASSPAPTPVPASSISPQPIFAHEKIHQGSHVGHQASQAHSAIGASSQRSSDSFASHPGLEGLRSPTLPNGMTVGGSEGDSGMQSPVPGNASGMGGMTGSLASLNLAGNSMHSSMNMSPGQHGAGTVPGQPGFSPIGSGADALRSRTASFVDTDPMAAFGGMRPGSSTAQRATYRPSQPAPIGPIGRPKAVDAIQYEDHAAHFGNGRSSSNTSGSGAASPRLPEGILGSSALGGDDDIIEPKPRRTSHTIPIGGGAAGSSAGSNFYGAGGPVGAGGGFGMGPASSPWSSFSGGAGGGGQSTTGPLSPAFNAGSGPGAIGSVNFAPGPPGPGSSGMGVSGPGQSGPWSRAQTSWDRARYAFEQPGGNGAGGGGVGLGSIGGGLHGGAQQASHAHHLAGPNATGGHNPIGMGPGQNGGGMGAFGLGAPGLSGPRNLFGAPGSGSTHPNAMGTIGALPSALSPTSASTAASRHLSGKLE